MRNRTGFLVTLSLAVFLAGPFFPAGTQAAGSPVEGDRRQLIEGFVEAFNSGDVDRMMSFYEGGATEEFRSRRSDEEDRALYKRLWDDLGVLNAAKMTRSGSDSVQLTARTDRGDTVTFVIRIAAGPPPQIQGFSVEIGGPPGGGDNPLPPIDLPGGAEFAQRRTSVDRYLRELADKDLFSGVVLVARGDKILFEGGYGLANREDRIPITTDTRFDIGSITKEITKAAIGQLARDGKLSLDDRLIDHVPDYPDRGVARKITVAQLVNHSSGLGDLFNERFENAPKDKMLTPRDFFPIFADEPLLFEPGKGRSYSNAGYIVLGAVVEGASGMSYTDYLQKHIFDPAGMADSGFPLRNGSVPELAIGYTKQGRGGDGLQRNIGMLPIRGCPAGSSSHTVADLLRFDRAVRSGKLLGPGWTRWFYTGSVPAAKDLQRPARYADGAIGIAGGGPGVNAMLESDGSETVIVLANLDPPIAGRVLGRLREAFEVADD